MQLTNFPDPFGRMVSFIHTKRYEANARYILLHNSMFKYFYFIFLKIAVLPVLIMVDANAMHHCTSNPEGETGRRSVGNRTLTNKVGIQLVSQLSYTIFLRTRE